MVCMIDTSGWSAVVINRTHAKSAVCMYTPRFKPLPAVVNGRQDTNVWSVKSTDCDVISYLNSTAHQAHSQLISAT